LLAAIHRICDPGPKTEVRNWYEHTILASEWGFPSERFSRHRPNSERAPLSDVVYYT
jgi:hypothetical protein